MRKYVFALLFTLIGFFAFSQDRILTNEGDTITCKITRVTSDFIHFSVFDKSGVLLMRSRLPLSGVSSYHREETLEGGEDESSPVIREEDAFIPDLDTPAKLRLSVNGGFTYQFGGYDGLPSSYTEQMQTLWNVGGQFSYFLSDKIGIGIKYSHVFTSANEDFEPPFSTAFGFSSIRDERIRFNSLGLSVLYRRELFEDNFLNYFLGVGLISYRTDLFADGIPFFQEGETLGVTLGGVYDVVLFTNFGIGIGGSVTLANISEINNNGFVVPTDFSISRVDLSLGIRFFQ